MRANLVRRLTVGAVGASLLAPFLVLPVQAVADEWRAPALWPQRTGTRGITRVLDDSVLPAAIANSTLVALMAVTAGLFVGWPAARALSSHGPRSGLRTLGDWRQGRQSKLMTLLVLLPLLLPPVVVGEGLQVWFLRLGLADRLVGIALAHQVYVVPYVVILLLPGFTASLVEQEQAAAGLGAGRWWCWWLVTLPAMRRQVGLAVAMGFTVSWSQYGTSLGVGGGIPMLPLVLVPFVRSDPEIAAVLDLIFLVPPLGVLLLSWRGIESRGRPVPEPA
jgi:putative spermidine/putrescine transport system permease protein